MTDAQGNPSFGSPIPPFATRQKIRFLVAVRLFQDPQICGNWIEGKGVESRPFKLSPWQNGSSEKYLTTRAHTLDPDSYHPTGWHWAIKRSIPCSTILALENS